MDGVTDGLAGWLELLLPLSLHAMALLLAAVAVALAFSVLASLGLTLVGVLASSVGLIAHVATTIVGGLRESAAHTRALHAWCAENLLAQTPLHADAAATLRGPFPPGGPLTIWVGSPENGVTLDLTVRLTWVRSTGPAPSTRLRWTYDGEDASLDLDAGDLTPLARGPGALIGFRAADGATLHLWVALRAPSDLDRIEVRVEAATPAALRDVDVRCFRGDPPPLRDPSRPARP